MTDELRSILAGTSGLSIAAGVALWLTLARGRIVVSSAQLRTTARVAVIVVLAQAAHFLEELVTGFHQRFPELLGLAPWSSRFFVSFNAFWLAVWGLSIAGLTARIRAALFPLWFLALACLANGLAHPALSVRSGGYFPGLITSPVVGVLGIVLLRQLSAVTGRRQPAGGR